jgi:hypothetical protein
MALSRQQRKTISKNKAKARGAGELAALAMGVTATSTNTQSQGEASVLQSETAFEPDSITHSQGLGGCALRAQQWAEIRAVKDRYPVSRGMLERVAHEAMQVATAENVSTRDKLHAAKLIVAMSQANQPNKGLPAPIEISRDAGMRTRQIIDAMANDPIHDTREFKIIPGSFEDYAE